MDPELAERAIDNGRNQLHGACVISVAHNYTPHPQAAIAAARGEAERSGSAYIGPEHLLQAVLALPQCGGVKAIARLGVSPEAVQ